MTQRRLDSSKITGHINIQIGSVMWSNPERRTLSVEICGLRGIILIRDLESLLAGSIDMIPVKSRSKSMVRLIMFTEDLESPAEATQSKD